MNIIQHVLFTENAILWKSDLVDTSLVDDKKIVDISVYHFTEIMTRGMSCRLGICI